MTNLNNLTSSQLRNKYLKAVKVSERTNAFDNLIYDIDTILAKRNRSAIFKAACKVLKNRGINQFAAAAQYADAVIHDDADYFSSNDRHEISGFYTKSGNPCIVYF